MLVLKVCVRVSLDLSTSQESAHELLYLVCLEHTYIVFIHGLKDVTIEFIEL